MCVVVLGSRPGSIVPRFNRPDVPIRVYTANGAYRRIAELETGGARTSCLVSKSIAHDAFALERLLSLAPNRIIGSRASVTAMEALLTSSSSPLELRGFDLAELDKSELLARHVPSVVTATTELMVKALVTRDIGRTLRLAMRLMRGSSPFGLSTGMTAVLLALEEHPKHRVVVSGIGLETGGHFYGSGKFSRGRAIIDRTLFRLLPRSLRDRVVTLDRSMSVRAGVKLVGDGGGEPLSCDC